MPKSAVQEIKLAITFVPKKDKTQPCLCSTPYEQSYLHEISDALERLTASIYLQV